MNLAASFLGVLGTAFFIDMGNAPYAALLSALTVVNIGWVVLK